MAWLLSVAILPILWLLSTFFSLLRNYQSARRIGLPIRVSPISPFNPIWYRFSGSVVPWLQRLPYGLGDFAASSYNGWSYRDKYALHQKLGGAFVQVNPGINEVFVADTKTVHDILDRRREFIRPTALFYGEFATFCIEYHF